MTPSTEEIEKYNEIISEIRNASRETALALISHLRKFTSHPALYEDVILETSFAGRRVIQDTVKETLPEEFQTAEYVKEHGGIDLVIERKYLNSTIGTLLSVLMKKAETENVNLSSDVVTIDKTLQSAS